MPARPDSGGTLNGARILIVDDEFVIAADLEFLFGDAGASVAVRTTLSAALEAARSDEFTAALLDIRLGTESSEPVADVLASRGIPFLFFSGQSVPDGMRAKFPNVRSLLKPARFGDLLSATAELLNERPRTAPPD
ncbi:MAG TPA: hypothetical protein VFB32_00695 [Rudaea sp.]|nr:hypothetical protein [Rudaea sp.]